MENRCFSSSTAKPTLEGVAWLYVALRIAHSLVQEIVNVVVLRFAIFMATSVVQLTMAVRAALAVP